jgi:hypothetical protein
MPGRAPPPGFADPSALSASFRRSATVVSSAPPDDAPLPGQPDAPPPALAPANAPSGMWMVHDQGSDLRRERFQLEAESHVSGGIVMGVNTRKGSRKKPQPYTHKAMRRYARYLRLGDNLTKRTIHQRWQKGMIKLILSSTFLVMLVLTFVTAQSLILLLSLLPLMMLAVWMFAWQKFVMHERVAALRKFYKANPSLSANTGKAESFAENLIIVMPRAGFCGRIFRLVMLALFFAWMIGWGNVFRLDGALDYNLLFFHIMFVAITFLFFRFAFPVEERVVREYSTIGVFRNAFALPPPCARFAHPESESERPADSSSQNPAQDGGVSESSEDQGTSGTTAPPLAVGVPSGPADGFVTTPMSHFAVAKFDDVEEVFVGWNIETFQGSARSFFKILRGGTRRVRVPDDGNSAAADLERGRRRKRALRPTGQEESDESSSSEDDAGEDDSAETIELAHRRKRMYWLCFRVRTPVEDSSGERVADVVFGTMLARPWPRCGHDFTLLEPNAMRTGLKPKYAVQFLKLFEVRRPELSAQVQTVLAIISDGLYG